MPLVWESPGPRVSGRLGGRSKYLPEAAELRTRPGEWALLRTYAPERTQAARQFAYQINHGARKAFPRGEYRADWRVADDGVVKVYVLYIGPRA
jgi:hypothetical protein